MKNFSSVISGAMAAIVLLVLSPGVVAQQQSAAAKQVVTKTGLLIKAPDDVAAPPADAQVMPSGLAMKVLTPGGGTEHPAVNDCVTVSFIAWTTDGALFSTSTTMNNSDLICVSAAILGVSEALKEMVVGEKRRLWVPEELTFHEGHHHIQRRPEDEEPPHKNLTFDLELLSILHAPATPADLKQPPETAIRTASGLAYQVVKSGTGDRHPAANNVVTAHVSVWRSSGKLFESTRTGNHPASIRVGTAMAGLRQALIQMVVGEKTRFWIPSALAYGETPANRFNPAGDLVYEVELLALK